MTKDFPNMDERQDEILRRWQDVTKLKNDYLLYLSRDDNSADINTDEEMRQDLVYRYYYAATQDADAVIDFFIYVIEHEKLENIKISAVNNLLKLSFEDYRQAGSYIQEQTANKTLSPRLNLQFHLANITICRDENSLSHLMDLIMQAQKVETTNIKYSSPDEGVIAWYLTRKFFGRRFKKGLEYEYVLPLFRQLLFSRSKSTQRTSASKYRRMTNVAEMRKIYLECMALVKDKNTPRTAYVNALYGLQGLYTLHDKRAYGVKFKGLQSYFGTLGGKKPTKYGYDYIPSPKEKRLSAKEKQYFQNRLDYR